jgi:hypothetical protein
MSNITIDITELGLYIDEFIIKIVNLVFSYKITSIIEAKYIIQSQNSNYVDYMDRLFDITTILFSNAKANNFEEFSHFLICSTCIISIFNTLDVENDEICLKIQRYTEELFDKFKNYASI